MTTQILCLDDSSLITGKGMVVAIGDDDRGEYIVLDRTVFYPQGGGQPADRGVVINSKGKRFDIAFVGVVDDEVRHYIAGAAPDDFERGSMVQMVVDHDDRVLNSRNHSAGHLLAFAAQEIEPALTPSKGYHFPSGPYVEFIGWPESADLEAFSQTLEDNLASRVAKNRPVMSFATTQDKLKQLCTFVPDFIPSGKPIRVMKVDDEGYPCGGTHVFRTGEIGKISVRKVKYRKGVLRVSYSVDEASEQAD